jgi:fructose-1,6-bisphosphatase II
MHELSLHLLRATQHAACAAERWVGRGEPKNADQAAVEALRRELLHAPGAGTVVIGEGAKDKAPMLYNGEPVGTGEGDPFDVAVDPLENTKACAKAVEGAISVAAVAPGGTLLASPGWYMDKLVVGPAAAGLIDIEAPLTETLGTVAKASGKRVEDVLVVVLDKPRHEELINDVRAAGARAMLLPEGDVLGSLEALRWDGDADVLLGVGGAPEGVISACAARLLGGDMQARLTPRSDEERQLLADAGQSEGARLTLDDLASSDEGCFMATGVTRSGLLAGPEPHASGGRRTQSFVATRGQPDLTVDAVCQDPTVTSSQGGTGA